MRKKIFGFCTALLLMCGSVNVLMIKAQDEIDALIENMTLEEKLGQMIMPDFRKWDLGSGQQNVTEINDQIVDFIATYKFGGVIFFAENVQETEQTVRLANDFQKAAIDNGVLPLFIAIDQEGGKVVRLGTGTSLPGNMALGATKSTTDAYDYGRIVGTELAVLDVNTNFSPSLDVNNNPSNPVIGERSISSDPQLVSTLGVALIQGMNSQNIITAAKHFPGHGDTATDSHVGLPVVNKTYEEIKKLELVPFQSAIDAGVDMVMTAHISYPLIDDSYIELGNGAKMYTPATLSKPILTGILREGMGFEGVVITDALNMNAISDNYTEVEALLKTIEAGTDIALMPTIVRSVNDMAKVDALYNGVTNAINEGKLTEERLDESVRRILELKQKRGILDFDNTTNIETKVINALNTVGSKEHHAIERRITQNSITVGQNKNYTLPLSPVEGEKVVLLAPYANEIPSLTYGYERLVTEGVIDSAVEYEVIRFTSTSTEQDFRNWISGANYVLINSELSSSSYLSNHWLTSYPELVVDLAHEVGAKAVILSIGKPYDLTRYPEADAIVLAYGAKGMDPTEQGQDPTSTYGPNIPTALDIVFGKVEPVGTLPVDILELNENNQFTDTIAYEVGYGLTNITTIEGVNYELIDGKYQFINDEFTLEVSFNDMDLFLDENSKLNWIYDENMVSLVSVNDNKATFKIIGDTVDGRIYVSSLVDDHNREFFLDDSVTVVFDHFEVGPLYEKIDSLFGDNGKVNQDVSLDELDELLYHIRLVPYRGDKEVYTNKLYAAKKTIIIRNTPFEGLPAVIEVGDSFTLYPYNDSNEKGEGWNYDETMFSATFNSPATFTALKEGVSTISYTDIDGDVQTVIVSVYSNKDDNHNTDKPSPNDKPSDTQTSNNVQTELAKTGISSTYYVFALTIIIVGISFLVVRRKNSN